MEKTKWIGFTVNGQPVAKGRPRMARRGKAVWAYTPKKTKDYEDRVALAFKKQCKKAKPIIGGVAVSIDVFFNAPKKIAKLDNFVLEATPHITRPDVDNVVKSVCDALNGLAWVDDSQIHHLDIEKYYSKEPRVCVKILEG